MPPIRIGLIGCGDIARTVHLNVLTSLPDVELTACAEADPQRRDEVTRRLRSATVYADYRDLLTKADTEAVVICLPNALHAEATLAALALNKHVYLEKPLATTLDDARRVLDAWRQTQSIGMIGFNYRFNGLYASMKEHIQLGTMAPLMAAQSVFAASAHTLPSWKQTRSTGGGVLLDLASHHFDLIRFVFGQEICAVFASLQSQVSEADNAVVRLQLADGLLVQSFFSLTAIAEDSLTVFGQKGKLTVDRFRSYAVETSESGHARSALRSMMQRLRMLRRSPYLLNRLLASTNEPSYRSALAEFCAAIRTNRPAFPDFQDGYRSMAIVAAAEASAETGKIVKVEQGD